MVSGLFQAVVTKLYLYGAEHWGGISLTASVAMPSDADS